MCISTRNYAQFAVRIRVVRAVSVPSLHSIPKRFTSLIVVLLPFFLKFFNGTDNLEPDTTTKD